MKKRILSAFLCGMLAISGVFMSSCGDDDDEDDDSNKTNSSGTTAAASDLVGTWQGAAVDFPEGFFDAMIKALADELGDDEDEDDPTTAGEDEDGEDIDLGEVFDEAAMRNEFNAYIKGITITFNADGTVKVDAPESDEDELEFDDLDFKEGTYTVEGNTIVITDKSGEKQVLPFEIKDGNLIVTSTDDESNLSIKVTFRKK